MRSENGLVTITGGKWTTYRKMGEDLVNQVEEYEDWEKRPCGTANLRIETSGAKTTADFVNLEMARKVEDVLSRRTRALVKDARGAQGDAEQVGVSMAEALSQDSDWIGRQVKEFNELADGWILK